MNSKRKVSKIQHWRSQTSNWDVQLLPTGRSHTVTPLAKATTKHIQPVTSHKLRVSLTS